MVYAPTAYNKAVKVRRLTAARLHKTPFGLRPLNVLLRHIFLCAGIASQFLHRAQKNVVYLFTLSEMAIDIFIIKIV